MLQNKKKLLAVLLTLLVFLPIFGAYSSVMLFKSANLIAQFGISNYAAKKAIDVAAGAGSVWTIIAIVGGSAGWGTALLAAAKALIKRYGKKAAVSW